MGLIYRDIAKSEFENIASRILYEDNHLLVFDKAVGEIVQGDKTGDEPLSETLKAFIAQRDAKPGQVFMGVTHRLDRPVAGLVVFAKTSKALERMNECFRKGDISKRYWALVESAPPSESGELRHYLLRNERQNKSYAYDYPKVGSKEAILKYTLLGATQKYFLVEVELLTGRHHQIRCQLAAMGSIIKGDLKYGARRSNKDAGISLYSKKVSFVHPVKKESITIVGHSDGFEELIRNR